MMITLPPSVPMIAPRISVVISNFNGATYLPRLLSSLRDQQDIDLEIVVVDRNSSDNSAAILSIYKEVIVIQEPPESGLVTGYAIGAEAATADVLFFCNEDMWFDPYCLIRLAEQIDLNSGIAAADPWQWTYDGQAWIHGGTRFYPGNFRSRSAYPLRRNAFTVPLTAGDVVPFACAGAVMISRRVYTEVGGWDRGFFLDAEDVDLFLRLWQFGWKCVTVPEAKVYHAVNVSNTKTLAAGRTLVSKKRYISGRSSMPIIGVKYFGILALGICLLFWFEVVIRHAVLLRRKQTWWNILAVIEFMKRLRPAIHYRRETQAIRRCRPGEKFFTAKCFQGQ